MRTNIGVLAIVLLACGNDGATGATGPSGTMGSMGTPGATGTPGVEGKPGTMGVMGSTGEAGAPGPVGDAGPQGDAGAPGTAVIGIGDTYVKPNACQGVADGVAADVCYSTCEDSNDILLSGGCSWTSTPAGPNVASIPNLFPGAGAPPGGGQGWACSRNVTDANAASSVSVRALCLRVPGP